MSNTLEKVQAAGNDISAVFEKYKLTELEAILTLESVKISVQTSIMRKAGAFIPRDAMMVKTP